MTVPAQGFSGPTWVQLPGNGSATVFAFPFLITAATDLAVGFVSGSSYSEQTSGFTVQCVYPGNGTVTFATPPPSGIIVDLRSQIPETQPTNFSNLGAYYPQSTTNAVDRTTRLVTDLYRLTYLFGIHGPDQESMPWSTLPNAAGRANSALLFDSNGLPTIGVLTSTVFTQATWNAFASSGLYPAIAAESSVSIVNYSQPVGSVLRYGTNTVPGTTNMATALQAAVTVVGLGGASQVVLPPGGILIPTTITMSNPGVWVVGGAGGSTIYAGSATLDVFEITANSCTLSDFQMTSGSGITRSGGYYVNVIGVISYTRIMRVTMDNFYNAIGFTGTGGGATIRVMDCDMQTNVNGGVGLNFVNTNPPVDVVLENLFITGRNLANQMLAGIQLVNVGDCTLKHVSTVYTGQGLNAAPGSGQEVQALFMSDCFFDSNTNNAININPAAGGSVYLVKAVNIWACTSASGIVLGLSNTGTIANTEWVNCYCSNNAAGSGFYIAGTIVADTLIEGGGFSKNNYGITIASGVTNFKIIGARVKSTGQFNANNTTSSLYMVGACDKFTIADCDFGTNAASFPAMSLGVGGQTWFVYGNQGFVTNGSGVTAAIATGATVTHGLSLTPTVVLLQAQDGTPSLVFPSAIGATTFTVNYAGGTTHAFAWRAGAWGN